MPADFNGFLWCRCSAVPGALTSVAQIATASSFSCDLRDSKHKCVSTIMRLIRHVVKRWVIMTRESKSVCVCVCSSNSYGNAELGCGHKEQLVCTADCIMLLRWFGAHLVTALHVNCISIELCMCVHRLLLPVTVCKELVPVEAWGCTVEADSG